MNEIETFFETVTPPQPQAVMETLSKTVTDPQLQLQLWLGVMTIVLLIVREIIAALQHRRAETERDRVAAELQAKVDATAVKLRQEAVAVAQTVKAQVEIEALAVKQQMEATEATVKQQAVAHAVQVARALRENIAITEQAVAEAQNAYHEANNSNKKIEAIRERFDEVLRLAARQREQQVDHIQETTDDTNKIVHDRLDADADADADAEVKVAGQ